MNEEPLITIAFGLIAVYVVLGNYLYLGIAVPHLSKKKEFTGASLMPSGQFEHLRKYASDMEAQGTWSWSCSVARHFAGISGAVLFVAFSLIVLSVMT